MVSETTVRTARFPRAPRAHLNRKLGAGNRELEAENEISFDQCGTPGPEATWVDAFHVMSLSADGQACLER